MANKAKALTKEQIICTALELIEESGVRACSMRALAKRLGVSAMTLYSYVEGQEEIFACVYDRFMTWVDVSRIEDERWDDTVRRIMRSWYVLIRQHARLSSLDQMSSSFQPLKNLAITFIDICLEQGMPQETASRLWSMCSALTVGAALRVRGEALAYGQSLKELDVPEATAQERAFVASYRVDAFDLSIEAIIGQVQHESGEVADSWRTPVGKAIDEELA